MAIQAVGNGSLPNPIHLEHRTLFHAKSKRSHGYESNLLAPESSLGKLLLQAFRDLVLVCVAMDHLQNTPKLQMPHMKKETQHDAPTIDNRFPMPAMALACGLNQVFALT